MEVCVRVCVEAQKAVGNARVLQKKCAQIALINKSNRNILLLWVEGHTFAVFSAALLSCILIAAEVSSALQIELHLNILPFATQVPESVGGVSSPNIDAILPASPVRSMLGYACVFSIQTVFVGNFRI